MNSFLAALVLFVLPVCAMAGGLYSDRASREIVPEGSDRPHGERPIRNAGPSGGAPHVVPVQGAEGMPEGLPDGMPWEQKSTDEGSGGEKAPAEDGSEGAPAPQEEAP